MVFNIIVVTLCSVIILVCIVKAREMAKNLQHLKDSNYVEFFQGILESHQMNQNELWENQLAKLYANEKTIMSSIHGKIFASAVLSRKELYLNIESIVEESTILEQHTIEDFRGWPNLLLMGGFCGSLVSLIILSLQLGDLANLFDNQSDFSSLIKSLLLAFNTSLTGH
ncbi:MAG: hypothetical protein R2880_19865 [Deinococcales bacterium]